MSVPYTRNKKPSAAEVINARAPSRTLAANESRAFERLRNYETAIAEKLHASSPVKERGAVAGDGQDAAGNDGNTLKRMEPKPSKPSRPKSRASKQEHVFIRVPPSLTALTDRSGGEPMVGSLASSTSGKRRAQSAAAKRAGQQSRLGESMPARSGSSLSMSRGRHGTNPYTSTMMAQSPADGRKSTEPTAPWRSALDAAEPGASYRPAHTLSDNAAATPDKKGGKQGEAGKGKGKGKHVGRISQTERYIDEKRAPSERIGSLYTPSAYGYSPKGMLEAALARQSNRINPNARGGRGKAQSTLAKERAARAAIEAEAAAAADAAIPIEEDDQIRSYLPLEQFDNLEYEMYTPEEWVAFGRDPSQYGTPARSKFFHKDGKFTWEKCVVLDYNPETTAYLIEWKSGEKRKWVKRLNLMFDVEDPAKFEQRVAEAVRLRRRSEAILRAYLFIEDEPSDRVPPMNEEQIDAILHLVAAEFPVAHLKCLEDTLAEVRDDYVLHVKKSIYDYFWNSPEERQRLLPLKLPRPEPKSIAPEFGQLVIPSHNFSLHQETVGASLFSATGEVIPALRALHGYYNKNIEHLRLVDAVLEKFDFPSALDDFQQRQQQHVNNVSHNLTVTWPTGISELMLLRLATFFDFYVDNMEAFSQSGLVRFLSLARLVMIDQLRSVIIGTVKTWVELFERYPTRRAYVADEEECDRMRAALQALAQGDKSKSVQSRSSMQAAAKAAEVSAADIMIKFDEPENLKVTWKPRNARGQEEDSDDDESANGSDDGEGDGDGTLAAPAGPSGPKTPRQIAEEIRAQKAAKAEAEAAAKAKAEKEERDREARELRAKEREAEREAARLEKEQRRVERRAKRRAERKAERKAAGYGSDDSDESSELSDSESDESVAESVQSFSELDPFQILRRDYQDERYIDDMPLDKPPLFTVTVLFEKGEFIFRPSFDDIRDSVQTMFNNSISAVDQVPVIDQSLMQMLNLDAAFLTNVDLKEGWVVEATKYIDQMIVENTIGPNQLRDLYRQYDSWMQTEGAKYAQSFSGKKSLAEYIEALEFLAQCDAEIERLTHNEVVFGLFAVQTATLKSTMCTHFASLRASLLQNLVNEVELQDDNIVETCKEIYDRLQEEPMNVEELTDLKAYVKDCEKDIRIIHSDVSNVRAKLAILQQYSLALTDQQFAQYCTAMTWPSKVETDRAEIHFKLEEHQRIFMGELRTQQEQFGEDLQKFAVEIDKFIDYGDLEQQDYYEDEVNRLQTALDDAKQRLETFNAREKLLGWQTTAYPQLQLIIKEFQPYAELWHIAGDWARSQPNWMYGQFSSIRADTLENQVTNWRKTLYKMNKTFKDKAAPRRVAGELREKIEEFSHNIPLVLALRNPGLRDRHWVELSDKIGVRLRPIDEDLSLDRMIKLNIAEHIELCEAIAAVASKEYSLEKVLDKMQGEWSPLTFDTTSYRDTGTTILRHTDDILQLLDDHIVVTQTMRGSPYIKPLEQRFQVWERKLNLLSDIMDEWLACQRSWLYLEPIFGSEDIMRQMPKEGKKFRNVDGMWRKHMDVVEKSPGVMSITSRNRVLETFRQCNTLLNEINKELNDYLETKRMSFPRFYFLSNDELLEILSQTRIPTAVQPHLRKCFENIDKLQFNELELKEIKNYHAAAEGEDGEAEPTVQLKQEYEIDAMFSTEGERVPFKDIVKPNSNVEVWLGWVEKSMKSALHDITTRALGAYLNTPRERWVLNWPGQIVLCVSQIAWTQEVTKALRSGPQAVIAYERKMNQQLSEVTELVRGNLTKLERATLGALVTIDVHARDTVTKLIQAEVHSEHDFEWTSQLRYYWEDQTVMVRIVNAQFKYGYEYLGNSARLVITPLTDRCYQTLGTAMQLHLGGAPEGPAGTGKTETTKDLAKALAKQCVVFNCSDGLDYLAMGKFFKGLAQAGAWSCFDEFNRIDLEVLSVIAQQIMTIQRAVMAQALKFEFEGVEIKLDPSCAVFITMNPGYAGRTELPDNLKALFRPVAMMVPDYALIAEISLYAFGFSETRNLARKIVATFRLASEQLSSQYHYDFGMRAVKSVLTAAGDLKRRDPDASEDVLILRSLKDCNIPKFLSEDIGLFENIVSDLFPGVEMTPPNYDEILEALEAACEQLMLQPTPVFMQKCLQLFETCNVRHGLMLVGPTCAGKTSTIQALALAHNIMEAGKPEDVSDDDERYFKVLRYTINPKSITQGQLYGAFDDVSHEWTDGVLAKTVRLCASSTTPDHKWMVFDGPVDAIWIENMNTVLDDNKKLCLNSGEIVKLSNVMTMMFEVEDLAVASPATVSRCGMVYMEPSLLGWQPLMKSWLGKLPPMLDKKLPLLESMFLWLVDPSLYYLRHSCKETITTTDAQLVISLMRVFESLIDEFQEREEGEEPFDLNDRLQDTWIESLFVFALVWSVGGTCDYDSREKFDQFFRHLLAGQDVDGNARAPTKNADGVDQPVRKLELLPVPNQGLVYDYTFDKKTSKWQHWMETVEGYKIAPEATFHDIIVPTIDTIRMKAVLGMLIEHSFPVLFVGESGTGKTVTMKDKLLLDLDPAKWQTMFLSFTAQTSANATQDVIDNRLEKRRKGVFGPGIGKQMVIFVDDLNMPAREFYGAQPPIELLRQFMDHRGWYDRATTDFRNLINLTFIASMGPPGGGRNPITQRYLRHFNTLSFVPPDDENLMRIFTTLLGWHLNSFVMGIRSLQEDIVKATIDVYQSIASELLPTPAKSHYTFNLRDLSKVFQGILQAQPNQVPDDESMMRLWAHECKRVFEDRLINDSDRTWFHHLLQKLMQKHFSKTYNVVVKGKFLICGGFMSDEPDDVQYGEIPDYDRLIERLEEYMEDYNQLHDSKMDLVLFPSCVEHVCRIHRIITQPFGNALLIGVGGSGRTSCAKLAAHMADSVLFQVEITKSYGKNEWHEDLRKVMRIAGLEAKAVTFLFNDTQLINDSFLEDFNNILNTGEVPGLFPPEDLEEVIEGVTPAAREVGKSDTRQDIYEFFVSRCRSNLHIVLCMSPVGNAFRARLRMFPSLVNCCTIDWFSDWSIEALEGVGQALVGPIQSVPDEMKPLIVEACVYFHASTLKLSDQYLSEQRRTNHVTPTSFLEVISTFVELVVEKQQETKKLRNRYITGVEKLLTTSSSVKDMQAELEALKPQLIKASRETEALMKTIQVDQKKADETMAQVKSEEEEASAAQQECQEIRDDCQADLDRALPALHAAQKALRTLNKADVVEVKSMKNPPEGVKLVMEAVCIMKSVKPKRVAGPMPGTKVDDYWDSSKKMLGDSRFLQSLIDYDRDNIPDAIIDKIMPYIKNPGFDPSIIQQSSKAATSLCKWVIAMESYYRVTLIVRPKQRTLAEADQKLAAVNARLAESQRRLQDVIDAINKLKKEYDTAVHKKEDLARQVDLCAKKLDRAQKLIGGLGGEKEAWTKAADDLDKAFGAVIGDVLLSSGVIAYLGAFTSHYRNIAVADWHAKISGLGIPLREEFRIGDVLSDAVEHQQWVVQGLPNDRFSIDNAVMIKKSRRWPLIIDPQGQANTYIKNMEKENKLITIKLTNNDFIRNLEQAVQFGTPVLIEDVAEELDPTLEPLLKKDIIKQGASYTIRIGDSTLEYEPDFRLYISTNLPNPKYTPETAVKVLLLNFTITPDALQDQLLGITVEKEAPALYSEQQELIQQQAANRKELKRIQDEILDLLSNAKGNILEDETLINVLAQSKLTSQEIAERVEAAKITETKLEQTRGLYTPVALRSSILYFCVADIAAVDPMYQYSLSWLIELFRRALGNAPPADDIKVRLQNVNEYFTYLLYQNVCRSLFEKDKLLFSFLLCIRLLQGEAPAKREALTKSASTPRSARGKASAASNIVQADLSSVDDVDAQELRFLTTGASSLQGGNESPKPQVTWITDKAWGEMQALATLPAFTGFLSGITEHLRSWQAYFDSSDPHRSQLPGKWNELTLFQKLLVLRCFRPDKMTAAVQDFISDKIGARYIDPPRFDLQASYEDSDSCNPLIFILSAGVDITADLLKFADQMGYTRKFNHISLGQGQGERAAHLINDAASNGGWLLLQNCHLAVSWLPELQAIVDGFNPGTVNPAFRLWLSSMPSDKFPVSILQNGVKMTKQPPKGIRANLMRSYDSFDDQFIMTEGEKKTKARAFRKMLFGLAFFHAIVQERRKFGALGWNIPYEFNESDLRICQRQLKMYLDQFDQIPYKALTYLCGQINYGGRVTDDQDRRTIVHILTDFYTDQIHREDYKFSTSGVYYAPRDGDKDHYLEFIDTLPINDEPEIFGLHSNAQITFGQKETTELLDTLLTLQPRTAGGAGMSQEEVVDSMAADILSKMPEKFDIEAVLLKYPISYSDSMSTVLEKDLFRFNRLIAVIKSSLSDLQKAIKGLVVMSSELEAVSHSLFDGRVPDLWAAKAYPSLKPLGAWVKDLLQRLAFMQKWIDEGPPEVFWLSGLFFPQAFMTGVMQNFARKYKIPVDTLEFDFKVMPTMPKRAPDDGCYIHGLFLEGARWDEDRGIIGESRAKELYTLFPSIWLLPRERQPRKAKDENGLYTYRCPTYKTSRRAGTLSTTGHSTNFILSIYLPSNQPEKHWVKRGVALLSQPD